MSSGNEHLQRSYGSYQRSKRIVLLAEVLLLLLLVLVSLSLGAVRIPISATVRALFAPDTISFQYAAIIREIRLPQTLSALAAGAGLAAAGSVMQVILQNPLGSPYTLGVSHAAAFGAACSVMFLGTGVAVGGDSGIIELLYPYKTMLCALLFALMASALIVLLSHIKRTSSEVMILAGVTIGALCTAGTMFLQYFADDIQLAAMVFWTFGDVGRVNWQELTMITVVTVPSILYFHMHRWSYNALSMGDETARGLGVPTERLRLTGMGAASLLTSVIIACVGVIGFVGLVAPHIARKVVGEDQRFSLAASVLTGGILLLASDLAARLILAPRVLPVAILTAFLGAPVFILLLIRGYR